MHAKPKVQGVWARVWNTTGDGNIVAQRQITSIPDNVVYHLLGSLLVDARGPVDWIYRQPSVRLYIDFEVGDDTIPF